MIIVSVVALWMLLGAFLLDRGIVAVGVVNQGPIPDWLAATIVYILALIIGPPLLAYAVIFRKDA